MTTDIRYGPGTALVVVDVQNDFADPKGSLYVEGGEIVVGRVNEEIEVARAAGGVVAYTQDWHPPSTPHFAKDGGVWPVHCVARTWGADFHPNLVVAGESVRKGTAGEDGYSGFTHRDPVTGAEASTGLADLLRGHGVERVVIAGLATDYCVKDSALDAVRLGFATTVVGDAIAAVDLQPGDGSRAIEAMVGAGVVLA
ncbi:MAG: isochorismatase family protein [Acidimicrobiales bacterium]